MSYWISKFLLFVRGEIILFLLLLSQRLMLYNFSLNKIVRACIKIYHCRNHTKAELVTHVVVLACCVNHSSSTHEMIKIKRIAKKKASIMQCRNKFVWLRKCVFIIIDLWECCEKCLSQRIASIFLKSYICQSVISQVFIWMAVSSLRHKNLSYYKQHTLPFFTDHSSLACTW